jgi:hypothetical protein
MKKGERGERVWGLPPPSSLSRSRSGRPASRRHVGHKNNFATVAAPAAVRRRSIRPSCAEVVPPPAAATDPPAASKTEFLPQGSGAAMGAIGSAMPFEGVAKA